MNPLRWRKMTWALVIFSALMLVWAIAGGAAAQDEGAIRDCMEGGILSRADCEDLQDAGTGLGVAFIFILWFIGFLILSLVWLMSRPKHRTCPHCGNDVKKGRTTCKNCGYDFTISGKPSAEAVT